MSAPVYFPYHHQMPTQRDKETQKVLLIFHRDRAYNTYRLINAPGLPISNACPFLQTGERMLSASAGLVAAVTALLACNEGIYNGCSYLMSWTANDNTHNFVILEKKTTIAQDKDQENEKASPATDSSFEDPNAQGWGTVVFADNNEPSSPKVRSKSKSKTKSKSEWGNQVDGSDTDAGDEKRNASPVGSARGGGDWYDDNKPVADTSISYWDSWTNDGFLAERADFAPKHSHRRPSTPRACDGGCDMEGVRGWAWTPSTTGSETGRSRSLRSPRNPSVGDAW